MQRGGPSPPWRRTRDRFLHGHAKHAPPTTSPARSRAAWRTFPPQDPENPCWTENWALPAAEQVVVVLGSPVGSHGFIAAKLARRLQEQDRLLSRIPRVPELQSAWLLLLYCATPRSTYLLLFFAHTFCEQYTAVPVHLRATAA